MVTDIRHWFKHEAKFGMMVHWGLYSLLGGEYYGRRTDYHAEWIQATFEIPKRDYEKLAYAFYPIYFDAEEWVKTAKAAGMNYIVVTSKHHEGFCLFQSEYDNFNVAEGSPFGRDVIAEIAEACRKYEMKLGLYYSQELDWHEPNGGGYKPGDTNRGISWTNRWDFPDHTRKNYEQCFRNKTLPQVKEILTKYGDLCLVWFDTPHVITPEQSKELYDFVKSIQPNCLVNSRVGNNFGDYRSCKDNTLPAEPTEDLIEAPVTMNHSWGYKSFDNDWKTADEVLNLKEACNNHGANLLLNVGPDHLGRIPAPCVDILVEVGKRLAVRSTE